MASSNLRQPQDTTNKIVVDPIHGAIHLSGREWDIVDTPSFQRLRQLKQLQMGQVAYPNATHTRFAHSLGVLGIMGRILNVAQSLHLREEDKENLRMAALLHDVGHYPYSHLMERVGKVKLTEEQVDGAKKKTLPLNETPYPDHEDVGRLIVTSQKDLLRAIGGKARAEKVAALFGRTAAADPQVSKLIHSSLDMDRLDYLLRDSRAAGVPFGQIDLNYLLNNLRMSPSGNVGISEKALPAAEQFLFARFFMHRTVYFHKTTFGIEEACRQMLRRVRDKRLFNLAKDGKAIEQIVTSADLGTFTDAYIDRVVHQAASSRDRVIGGLARAIQSRRPPKLLKEVHVLRDSKDQHHAGATFKKSCQHKLEPLAKKFGLPLGLFLLAEFPPIKFEQRAAMLSRSEHSKLEPEEREELIKIFVSDEDEPKSIVDIPHSIIRLCSGYGFQTFRLYAVLDHEHERHTHALKEEVTNWDK